MYVIMRKKSDSRVTWPKMRPSVGAGFPHMPFSEAAEDVVTLESCWPMGYSNPIEFIRYVQNPYAFNMIYVDMCIYFSQSAACCFC